jgi:hypothetical protein
MVEWLNGWMVLWFYGFMVKWFYGFMVGDLLSFRRNLKACQKLRNDKRMILLFDNETVN